MKSLSDYQIEVLQIVGSGGSISKNLAMVYAFKSACKKLVNGFMDSYGKRIVCRGLYLATRKEHDS